MLNMEALNFNAGTVKTERRAPRAADARQRAAGDFGFAFVINEARQERPPRGGQAGRPREPGTQNKASGDIDEMKDMAQQNTAAAELFSMMPASIPQQDGQEDMPDIPDRTGGNIVSILEGILKDTDMTPPSAETVEWTIPTAQTGETARMPQQPGEALAGFGVERTPIVSTPGPDERPAVQINDGPCPLENENEIPSAAVNPAMEKTAPDGEDEESESAAQDNPQAGTPRTASVKAERRDTAARAEKPETRAAQVPEANRPADIPAQRLDSAVRFEAEVLGARRAEPPVRPGELFDTMVARMETASSADGKVMTIQLRPEFLGKVQIQLAMTQGGLSAKILTEDSSVRGLINSQINQLVETLNDRGIKVNEVEVLYTGVADHEFGESRGKQDAREDGRDAAKSRIIRVESALRMAVPYANWETAQDDGLYAGDSSVEYTA